MNQSGRIQWIVSLRALAAIAVVFLHEQSWVNQFTGGGISGLRSVLIDIIIPVFVKWAVPVFLMISGFLLLDSERKMDLQKIKSYVLRMLKVYILFGMFYAILESAALNGFSNIPKIVLEALRNLFGNPDWDNMWYISMLIGLYLITPVLSSFAKEADRKTYQFVLASLFLPTIVIPTINASFDLRLIQFVPISSPCLFYYMLGGYFRREKVNKAIVRTALFVGIIGYVFVLSIHKSGMKLTIGTNDNAFIALYSSGLFALAIDHPKLEQMANQRGIRVLSQDSFGIYLIHFFYINVFYKVLHIYPVIFPALVGELLFLGFFVGLSVLSGRVLCRIKFFRKILI